jgi:hypothetical protein
MFSKSTTTQSIAQPLISRVAKQAGIIFLPKQNAHQVQFLYKGLVYDFEQLPLKIYVSLVNAFYQTAIPAKNIVYKIPLKRQVELFVYKSIQPKPALTLNHFSLQLTKIAKQC